jgi:RNA polymerase sigma-70 factor (ECF subfamily)
MTDAELHAALSPAVRAWCDDEAKLGALRDQLATAEARWPTLPPARPELLAALCAGLDAEPARILERRAADVHLALACARGEPAALRAFEQHALGPLPATLARQRPSPSELDDVRQHLRTHLLVATPPHPPRIVQYAGDADLGAWIRVIATRALLDRRRASDTHRPRPLDEAAAAGDPVLAGLRAAYREHFRAAFRQAVAELPARARTVLRLQLLDNLTLAEIGAVFGVHEATASRWAAAARRDLAAASRAALRARLDASPEELESALRLVGSQLDASVSAALRDGG